MSLHNICQFLCFYAFYALMLAWYWKSTTLQNRSRKSLPSWHWILEQAWAKRSTIGLYRHYSIHFLDWSNVWIWTGRVGQKLVLVLTDLFSFSCFITIHFFIIIKTHVSYKMVIDNNIFYSSLEWKMSFLKNYCLRSESRVLNLSKFAVLKSKQ